MPRAAGPPLATARNARTCSTVHARRSRFSCGGGSTSAAGLRTILPSFTAISSAAVSRPRVRPGRATGEPGPRTGRRAGASAGSVSTSTSCSTSPFVMACSCLCPSRSRAGRKRVRIVPSGGLGQRPTLPPRTAAQNGWEPLVKVLVERHLRRAHIPVRRPPSDVIFASAATASRLKVVRERLLLALRPVSGGRGRCRPRTGTGSAHP